VAEYFFGGRRYRESTGRGGTEKDAAKLLRRRLTQIERGEFLPRADCVTLADLGQMVLDNFAVNRRRTAWRVEATLKRLYRYFGRDARATTITSDALERYVAARLKAGLAPATIKLEVATVRRGFRLALRAGRLARMPLMPQIHVSNARQGFFEPAELAAVLGALAQGGSYRDRRGDDQKVQPHPELVPLVRFAALTGWRKGEVMGLQWKQVDFKAQTVRLEPGTTKNLRGRIFPFGRWPELATLLREQRERTDALQRTQGSIIPHVFHRGGRPIKDFRGAWSLACRVAGVARLFHDLRRTAVRALERAAVPRSQAMKLTGHVTEAVYTRYAIVSESDLAEAVAKRAALPGGNTDPETDPAEIAPPETESGARRNTLSN
jgi:integrase